MGGWVAVHATTDRRTHALELARAHERMANGQGSTAHALRPVVERSWERSTAAGVDPAGGLAPRALDEHQVNERWAAHPLSIAVPVIRGLLEDVGDEEHLAAVCDADGSLLWLEGRPPLLESAAEAGMEPGTLWTEQAIGTNGVGTALAERHPIQIFSAEHFATPIHGLTCTAAPVHDPLTGELLGVIDITGSIATAHPHSLALVSLAARTVEQQLLTRAQATAQRILRIPQATLSVMGRDRGLLRAGGREVELSRRHTEMLLLLWLVPEGLTAEQLALEVYGEQGRPGSVRTEMHRLRTHLGPLIAERPYRLQGVLDCDFAGAEKAVGAGDLADALVRHRGPVLPQTEVPRLVELRERLEDHLRASVLASGDATLLEAWLSTPSGRDDFEVSRALVTRLGREDPRRAAERPRLRRLAEERRAD